VSLCNRLSDGDDLHWSSRTAEPLDVGCCLRRRRDSKEEDTKALRTIAELAERRAEVESELTEAVRSARHARRSWSEIGTILGVSKQAAHRTYGSKLTA